MEVFEGDLYVAVLHGAAGVEIWRYRTTIHADGFESGGTDGWSHAVP